MVARLEPWIAMIEDKLQELLADSPAQAVLPAAEAAFAIVALYLGVDMLSHLQGDHARAESLLALGERYAPFIGAMLSSQAAGSS